MKKVWFLWATLAGAIPFVSMLAIAGCGGSGGPLRPPDTGGGGGPSISAAFRALWPDAQQSATYVGSDTCRTCHESGVGGAPVVDYAKWEETRHAQLGIGCEQCHGPGSVHVAGPAKANILTFPNLARSEICAQCHGPMAADFYASPHAKVVEDVVNAATPQQNMLALPQRPVQDVPHRPQAYRGRVA